MQFNDFPGLLIYLFQFSKGSWLFNFLFLMVFSEYVVELNVCEKCLAKEDGGLSRAGAPVQQEM